MAALEFIGATAGGAAEGLEDVLRRRFLEIQQRNQDRQFEVEQERLRQQDAYRRQQDLEGQRRWDATNARLTAADARDKARDDAAAVSRGERDAFLGMLQNNPAEFYRMPLASRQAAFGRFGISAGRDTLESPEERAAREKADEDRDFADYRKRTDYSVNQQIQGEERRDNLAQNRVMARLRMDDPQLPFGVQNHLTTLRAKHPTFEAALAEFNNSIPAHQQAHRSLSPTKAVNALRQLYTGGARPGGSDDDDLLNALLGGNDVAGMNLTAPGMNQTGATDLTAAAAAHLRSQGLDSSREAVGVFLSKPGNVAGIKALMTKGGS